MKVNDEQKQDEKLNPDELLPVENELLRGLLEAAEDKETARVKIEIARKGKVLFSFHVHALNEGDFESCRDKATTYSRKNKVGMKLPEDTNTTLYRSRLIYTATDENDRKMLWDNPKAKEKLNVISGVAMIEKVLYAGEKDAIISKIEEISGYTQDGESTDNQEEIAKNS